MIGSLEDAPFTAGICELWASTPITFERDDHAVVCFMIEGQVTITEGEAKLDFEQGDVVFLPQREGLVVTWDTPSYGRWLYVTYPHRSEPTPLLTRRDASLSASNDSLRVRRTAWTAPQRTVEPRPWCIRPDEGSLDVRQVVSAARIEATSGMADRTPRLIPSSLGRC